MSAEKRSISAPSDLFARAAERQKQMHFSTFSDYIQALIRADVMRAGVELKDEVLRTNPPNPPAASSPAPSPGAVAAKKVVAAAIESARASATKPRPPTPPVKYPPHRPSK